MPYRYFDWECTRCGITHSPLTWVVHGEDPPNKHPHVCPVCEVETRHVRLMSMPAKYTYDKPYAPIVAGGKFDTAGWRRPPKLPELPSDACYDQAKDFFNSKQHRESVKERMDVIQQNKVKQQRAKAIEAGGNVDLRTNPLPGDPKPEGVGKKRRKLLTKVSS